MELAGAVVRGQDQHWELLPTQAAMVILSSLVCHFEKIFLSSFFLFFFPLFSLYGEFFRPCEWAVAFEVSKRFPLSLELVDIFFKLEETAFTSNMNVFISSYL